MRMIMTCFFTALLLTAAFADTDAIVFRPVYGPTLEADGVQICFHVRVPTDDLQCALDRLGDALSRFMFDRLPLAVRLEDEPGVRVAVVSLAETEAWRQALAEYDAAWAAGEEAAFPHLPGQSSWRARFFQGSTGGELTSRTLRQTFLQPDTEGPWVDAVRFEYESSPMTADWDHVTLSGTFYREDVRCR